MLDVLSDYYKPLPPSPDPRPDAPTPPRPHSSQEQRAPEQGRLWLDLRPYVNPAALFVTEVRAERDRERQRQTCAICPWSKLQP